MNFHSSRFRKRLLWILSGAALAYSATQAIIQWLARAWYVAHAHAYVNDGPYYWAMGRGILNGLTLYRDLFDNKPPGIDVLAALSLTFFGNGLLGGLLGSFLILATPVVVVLWMSRRLIKTSGVLRAMILALTGFATILFTLYQAERGGAWQTEFFGAFFGTLFVMLVLDHPPRRTLGWRRMIASGLALGIACGFKEPFLLTALACVLLIDPHPRCLLRAFLAPTVVATLIGGTVMMFFGWLQPYLAFYLPAVMGFRIQAFGPLWARGFAQWRVLRNLFSFSWALPILILFLFAVWLVLSLRESGRSLRTLGVRIVTAIVALYLATTAVGMGGDFQSHHFVFAVPFFFTLLILFCDAATKQWHWRFVPWLAAIALVLSAIPFLTLMHPQYSNALAGTAREEIPVRAAADALDAVMDRCSIDRYLYVEGNHPPLYGYTRHSPLNAAIFWQIDNAIQYGDRFANLSFQRISQGSILVEPASGFVPTSTIGEEMATYFGKTFSADPPPCAQPLPQTPDYTLFFRVSPERLKLRVTPKGQRPKELVGSQP
ncbi:hypothetical protein HY213_01805 [Candidatus Peregrinibacteria bacterium]|nr:hypothetical protein [Candidatus Peregrinibacteria bacterium]